MTGLDNIYVWIRPKAIIVARGTSDEDALKNLRTMYRKDTLVETYGILTYDGYFVRSDIVLHGEEMKDLPEAFRKEQKLGVILDRNIEYKEREKDKYLELDKGR
jgi:hypothetical protein